MLCLIAVSYFIAFEILMVYFQKPPVERLLENGCDANASDDISRSPLHIAATKGNPQLGQYY